MRFWLHETADAELDAAVAYYEGCRPDLGLDFADEAYAAIALACSYPDIGVELTANTRTREHAC